MERSLVFEVQRALRQREHELRERDARVTRLERQVAERDSLIVQLRTELDKCHQVLQVSPSLSPPPPPSPSPSPLTAAAPWRLATRPGDGGAAIVSVEQRLKRMAISAEPLSELKQSKFPKVPKTAE